MRFVIQKVNNGKVAYKDKIIREIKKGNIFYVGIETGDTVDKINECTDWIVNYIDESSEEALLLSQFTLFGQFKGKKPSFHRAMKNHAAKEIFYKFVEDVKQKCKQNVESGLFGEYLDILYSSDGLETKFKDFNN